jgi:hypothetical protein
MTQFGPLGVVGKKRIFFNSLVVLSVFCFAALFAHLLGNIVSSPNLGQDWSHRLRTAGGRGFILC